MLASSVSLDRSKGNNLGDSLNSARKARLEETNILSKMIQGRNWHYKEPFQTIDVHQGKKLFDPNFRPLRSKINIKINAAEA